jgi:hypothetical protein
MAKVLVAPTRTFHKVVLAREILEGGDIKNPYVDLEPYADFPLYFFGGPLQGAPDWHPELFKLLQERLPYFIAVLPTRYAPNHPLYQYRLIGKPNFFARQRHYEAFYIKAAREARRRRAGGALLLNLCCQSQPRNDGRPYGTDSWREASETYTRLEYEPDLRVLIRAEENFPGRELLKDCYDAATKSDFPFYETLEELADAAALCAYPH